MGHHAQHNMGSVSSGSSAGRAFHKVTGNVIANTTVVPGAALPRMLWQGCCKLFVQCCTFFLGLFTLLSAWMFNQVRQSWSCNDIIVLIRFLSIIVLFVDAVISLGLYVTDIVGVVACQTLSRDCRELGLARNRIFTPLGISCVDC